MSYFKGLEEEVSAGLWKCICLIQIKHPPSPPPSPSFLKLIKFPSLRAVPVRPGEVRLSHAVKRSCLEETADSTSVGANCFLAVRTNEVTGNFQRQCSRLCQVGGRGPAPRSVKCPLAWALDRFFAPDDVPAVFRSHGTAPGLPPSGQ